MVEGFPEVLISCRFIAPAVRCSRAYLRHYSILPPAACSKHASLRIISFPTSNSASKNFDVRKQAMGFWVQFSAFSTTNRARSRWQHPPNRHSRLPSSRLSPRTRARPMLKLMQEPPAYSKTAPVSLRRLLMQLGSRVIMKQTIQGLLLTPSRQVMTIASGCSAC